MQAEPLIIERNYDAPIEKVWEAITDAEKMRQWYFDLKEFRAEAGFEFQFSGKGNEGQHYLHLCRVMEVVPGRKLAYSWRYKDYDGLSVVTFELFDENGKTRLKLTHSGIETFPASPDFARSSFTAGWTYLTGTALPEFLAKS